MQAGAELF